MSNPFEQLKTAEDFKNFFLALLGDDADKGIECFIYNPDPYDDWRCISYADEEYIQNSAVRFH